MAVKTHPKKDREIKMKKFIAAVLLATSSTFALALTGWLSTQWVEGTNRFCKYSNGKIVTVGLINFCLMTTE